MDDQRVQRRRRGPLQLALGGVLVVLELLATTVGDGGFYLPAAQPAGSLFEVG